MSKPRRIAKRTPSLPTPRPKSHEDMRHEEITHYIDFAKSGSVLCARALAGWVAACLRDAEPMPDALREYIAGALLAINGGADAADALHLRRRTRHERLPDGRRADPLLTMARHRRIADFIADEHFGNGRAIGSKRNNEPTDTVTACRLAAARFRRSHAFTFKVWSAQGADAHRRFMIRTMLAEGHPTDAIHEALSRLDRPATSAALKL